MKRLILYVFRILLVTMIFALVSANCPGHEVKIALTQNDEIHKKLLFAVNSTSITQVLFKTERNDRTCKTQDQEGPQTKEEKKQLRKEKRLLNKEQKAEKREQLRIQMAEERDLPNPNHADYILLGKNLPNGQNVLTAITGRVPGLTISNSGYVTARGPISFYGGGAALFLVNGVEMNPDYVKSINTEEVDRVEVFMGSSAAMYGTRVGAAVISIYTIQSLR
jgi:hypothetical protein